MAAAAVPYPRDHRKYAEILDPHFWDLAHGGFIRSKRSPLLARARRAQEDVRTLRRAGKSQQAANQRQAHRRHVPGRAERTGLDRCA